MMKDEKDIGFGTGNGFSACFGLICRGEKYDTQL